MGKNKVSEVPQDEVEELEVEEITEDEFGDDPVEEDEDEAEATFTAKEIASELGLTPKDFRRWLRSKTDRRANKGGRWIFTAEEKADWVAKFQAKDEAADDNAEADATA